MAASSYGLPGWCLQLAALSTFGFLSSCQSTATSSDSSTDALSDTAQQLQISPDLSKDPLIGSTTGAVARYELTATDWHASPFPTNTRRGSDGRLDLSGFPAPKVGEQADLLKQYLDYGQASLSGWSLQPTAYVQFDAPLDVSQVVDAAQSLEPSSPYQLLDIDPSSPTYGVPTPVQARLSPKTRGQYLVENLLMIQPVWGHPLRPKTTYALLVRRDMRDAQGKVLGRPTVLALVVDKLLDHVLDPQVPASTATLDVAQQKLADSLQPLVAAYLAAKISIPYKDLAAATVFTTGDPSAQLRAMAAFQRTQPPVQAASGWKSAPTKSKNFVLFTGQYPAPNYQVGDCPYNKAPSGGFAFASDGSPIAQHQEMLRVSLAVPVKRSHDTGSGQVPVAMYAHGTGGDYLSFSTDGTGDHLTAAGIAVVSIDQPMHGPRCTPEITGNTLDAASFNFFNIYSGLASFRQSALDSVLLARMIRNGYIDLPAGIAADGLSVHLDPTRVSFLGHSQGGLSGALLAAVDNNQLGYVLSGAGAGLSQTILLRKYPMDFSTLVGGLLGLDDGEISEYHPAISLVQLLADITDPLTYGPLILNRQSPEKPVPLLLTEGLLDQDTPSATAEALAACIGLDILAPLVHANDALTLNGAQVLDSPVQNNWHGAGVAVTAVVSQWAKYDHFVIFDSTKAAAMYKTFLESLVTSGVATAQIQ